MNRKVELSDLLQWAQFNGFNFRKWYEANIRPVWPGTEIALEELTRELRYYALVFSHDFAQHFWRAGSIIRFAVPASSYQRVNSAGRVIVVKRSSFTRRSAKPNVWKYHIGQMAAAPDPLVYLRRFLPGNNESPAADAAAEDDVRRA